MCGVFVERGVWGYRGVAVWALENLCAVFTGERLHPPRPGAMREGRVRRVYDGDGGERLRWQCVRSLDEHLHGARDRQHLGPQHMYFRHTMPGESRLRST